MSQEGFAFAHTQAFDGALVDHMPADLEELGLQSQMTQTRPVVPMPMWVYRELIYRYPAAHEWFALGLQQPQGQVEWEGWAATPWGCQQCGANSS